MAEKVREIGSAAGADFEVRKAAFENAYMELCSKYRVGLSIVRTEIAHPGRPLATDFYLDAYPLEADQIEALKSAYDAAKKLGKAPILAVPETTK